MGACLSVYKSEQKILDFVNTNRIYDSTPHKRNEVLRLAQGLFFFRKIFYLKITELGLVIKWLWAYSSHSPTHYHEEAEPDPDHLHLAYSKVKTHPSKSFPRAT